NTHMMEECYHSEALESSAKESNQRIFPISLHLSHGFPVPESGRSVKDGDKVTEVQPGSSLTVTTASGVYGPESLVITAGHWANTLVSNIGLQLPQQLGLLNLSASGTYGISHFPCFVQMGEEGAVYHFYGLLSNECPGLMKVTPDHHFVLDCHPHHGNIVIGAGFLCMFTGVPIQLSWSWYCVLASLYNIYLHIPALKNHIKTYSQMATC
uniref:Uncharacterized protein n=1 Tax=Oncorhynchus tshawytscha TaxID=74940 RepID=A0A8C8F1G9_ONCTS